MSHVNRLSDPKHLHEGSDPNDQGPGAGGQAEHAGHAGHAELAPLTPLAEHADQSEPAEQAARAGDGADAQLILVTGISGSGKSVAMHALEDAGFNCIDNLPPELLPEFLRLSRQQPQRRTAVAVDARTVGSLPALLATIERLRRKRVQLLSIFLDANTPTLVRRFSETRRPHPLSMTAQARDTGQALTDAIEHERALLSGIREVSAVVDTSHLRPAQLRRWVRDIAGASGTRLSLVFESFGYKQGVPLDADLVFDLRVLPNPYYVRELRPLDGRDEAVRAFLDAQPEAGQMLSQIESFIRHWLPGYEADSRGLLTVALGCTGGQHRSVYAAQWLGRRFANRPGTVVRHREMDALEA